MFGNSKVKMRSKLVERSLNLRCFVEFHDSFTLDTNSVVVVPPEYIAELEFVLPANRNALYDVELFE